MNFVTDPKLLEELNAGFNPQGASAPSVDSQTQTAPQEAETNWGIYAKEDGSIMDTIGSGLTRMGRATAAAMVPSDDEDMSDYALARARRANAEYKADAEKLGLAGQVVAGAATYAPVIAAGIANPLAGAAMMGGATTADSLAAQIDNNQDLDLNTAIAAGAASAGVDLATMGLASRGMNVAKELTSPVKRAIAGTGIQATQGATSNAAAQAAINLASGRPWNEGLTEAAAIGGVAGGGLHATLSGLNHSTGTPPNKGGQKATEDQVKFETKDGITPTGDYRNQVYEYANQRHQYDEDINNIDIEDTAGLDAAVNAKVGMALNNGTASAIQGTAKLLDKFKVPKTINFWDMEVGNGISGQTAGNIARDWFNFSDKDLLKAGESISRAKQTLTGRTKALEQGEFEEAFLRQMKDAYDKAQNDILGRAESNWRTVDNIRSQMTGAERPMRDALNILSRNLEDYSKMVRDANLGKAPNIDALRSVVESIEVNAKKTGLRDKLKSLVDDAEQFDGITNLESALLFAKGAQKVAPGIHRANPDPLKASSQKADMLDAAAIATGQFWLPVARRGLREIGGKRSQARLRGEKAQGEVVSQSLARDPRPDFTNQAAQRGDFKGAADEAAADLESMGISTGQKDVWGREPEPTVRPDETAPVQEPTPESAPAKSETDVWGRPKEFTDLTGRNVRDAEVEAQRRAEEAQREPVVDPEMEAAARAQRDAALSQDARVDSRRVTSEEAPAARAEELNTDNMARIVLDDGSMVVLRPNGTRQVVRPPLGEDIAVTQSRIDAEDSAKAIVESNKRKTQDERIDNARRLEDVEGGKSETLGDDGLTIVHGSGRGDMTLDDIQIVRDGQKQGKKGRKYGGFYGAREADIAHAEGYAGMGGDTPTVYDVKVKPGTKVFHKEGDITRLSENYINDLKSKGYGVVAGTDPRGRVEYAVINKDAIDSLAPRQKAKEVEPEAPKKEGVKAYELARKPITDKIKEFKELSPEAKKDPQLINEFTRNRRLLSDADKAVSSKATAMSVPQEDIWRIIERQGGLESVFKDGHSAERGLNILMQKDKIDLQRKADIEAKNAEDAADSVNTESGKGEKTSADEVDTGKVIEDMKKDFISKGVSGETFEAAQVRAEQTLGPDYTPTQLANVVKLLAKEKAAKAREEAKKTSKAAKTSTPAATPTVGRTMQDSWNDIHGYAQTLGVDAEPEIRKALKSAMNSGNKDRAKFKALSEAKERELYNKVDDFIAEQQKAYERALAAPKTEQPAELGEWRKKVADLKKRRARVSNFNDWQTKKADDRKAIAEKAIKEEEARTKRLEAEAKKADDEAKAADKAIKDAEEAKAAEQKKMEEAVEKAFEEKDMDADVIVEAGSQLFEKLAARVNSTDSPDYNKLKAIMTVVERNLPVTKLKTGERNQAKALLLSQKALFDGLARKAEFPNNPEYWLSTTERDLIGEAYTGKQGTKEYGSMYQRLRAGLFEDESTREYVRFPIEALNRKIKNLRKRAENTTELGEGAINVQDIK